MRKALPEPVVILNKKEEEEFVVVPKKDYVPPVSIWTVLITVGIISFLTLVAAWIICRILKKLT